MRGCVYRIQNSLNAKVYIGITIGKPAKRWQQHLYHSSHCKAIAAALKKYGIDNFKFTVIEEVPREELSAAEIRHIAAHESYGPKGYNLTPGGEMSPFSLPEVQAKIQTLECKAKRQEASAKVRKSQASRNATSKASKKLWQSDGHSEKMSGVRKQMWQRDGQKKKQSEGIRTGFQKKRTSRIPQEGPIVNSKLASGYEGVYRHSNKWRAVLTRGPRNDRQTIRLGTFSSALDAAIVYADYLRKEAADA